jgi:hypothetical protein
MELRSPPPPPPIPHTHTHRRTRAFYPGFLPHRAARLLGATVCGVSGRRAPIRARGAGRRALRAMAQARGAGARRGGKAVWWRSCVVEPTADGRAPCAPCCAPARRPPDPRRSWPRQTGPCTTGRGPGWRNGPPVAMLPVARLISAPCISGWRLRFCVWTLIAWSHFYCADGQHRYASSRAESR